MYSELGSSDGQIPISQIHFIGVLPRRVSYVQTQPNPPSVFCSPHPLLDAPAHKADRRNDGSSRGRRAKPAALSQSFPPRSAFDHVEVNLRKVNYKQMLPGVPPFDEMFVFHVVTPPHPPFLGPSDPPQGWK